MEMCISTLASVYASMRTRSLQQELYDTALKAGDAILSEAI